jgi:hypothetical protein
MKAYLRDTPISLAQFLDYQVGQRSAKERNGNCSCDLSSENVSEGIERPVERWLNQQPCEECSHKHVDTESRRVACRKLDSLREPKMYYTHMKINHRMFGNQMIWTICFQQSIASDQLQCPFHGSMSLRKLRGA